MYHFHLGVGLITHGKSKNFIKRTQEVALAKVTNDSVIFILIEDHNTKTNPDIWYDQQCIQILHDEFPYIIEPNRVKRMVILNPVANNQIRRNFRKINLNCAVTVSDGTSYTFLGGGVVASGQNGNAVRMAFGLQRDIKLLIDSLRPQLLKLVERIHKQGAIKLELIHIAEHHTFFDLIINNQKHLLVINEKDRSFKLFFRQPDTLLNESLTLKLKKFISASDTYG